MKINDMPDSPAKEAIIVAASAVMGRCTDMHHLLEQANQFLNHDFPPGYASRKASDSE